MSRKYAALQQRMYLLRAEENEIASGWKFVVEGASGTPYTVCFGTEGCSCTCPDFTYRHNYCKHILFIIGRVAKDQTRMHTIRESHNPDSFVFDCDLSNKIRTVLSARGDTAATATTTEVQDPHALQVHPKEDHVGGDNTKEGPIDECPICYEPISPTGVPDNQPLDRESCPTCHKVLHYSCMQRWWKNNKKTCPMCRSVFINPRKKHVYIIQHEDDHLSKLM